MSHLLSDIVWEDLNIDLILQDSYKDFHAKGLDYICLHRDPSLTLKAYFFADGMESQPIPEVINPHDHRYDFMTQCFSGLIRNKWYTDLYVVNRKAQWYTSFFWDTPLNGGNGFEYAADVQLTHVSNFTAGRGEKYYMNAPELHTIQVMQPETCIVLAQYEDVVPVGTPTRTYSLDRDAPSLLGLYSEFTADEVIDRLELLHDLAAKL